MRLMVVNHRCAEIPVSQELLAGPGVVTVFEEMGCKGVQNGAARPESRRNSTALRSFSRPKGPSHAFPFRIRSLMS